MRKATILYFLAGIMLLLALFQAISGFVLWLVLPGGGRGYMGGKGGGLATESTFLWSRHTWMDLHDWVAVALVVLVALHLILHLRWIVYMTKAYFGQKECFWRNKWTRIKSLLY